MNSSPLSLSELIERVNTSVQNSTFDKDYETYLKECRKLGVSSYVLNVLVGHAKKQGNSTTQIQPDVNFFIKTGAKINDNNEISDSSESVVFEVVKKTPEWIIVILLFLIVFVAGFAYNSFAQRKMVAKLKEEKNDLRKKMDRIVTVSDGVRADVVFDDWKSDNHNNNTASQKSYYFKAGEGDVLSFGYVVSSESCCDSLSVILQCPNDSIVRLVRGAKGEVSSSCDYTITQSGSYALVLMYSKDYSVTKSLDCAFVNNIRIRRNTNEILGRIHKIASEESEVVISQNEY